MKKFMKKISAVLVSEALRLLFIAAAFFSPEGMGFTISGYPWVPKVADVVDNFVPVIAVISLIISTILIAVMMLVDGHIDKAADEAIKQYGSAQKAYVELRFKPGSMAIVVVFWLVLIGAGWIFSAICYMISTWLSQVYQIALRSEIENRLGGDS